jgi:hypothetical protein
MVQSVGLVGSMWMLNWCGSRLDDGSSVCALLFSFLLLLLDFVVAYSVSSDCSWLIVLPSAVESVLVVWIVFFLSCSAWLDVKSLG